MENMSLGGVGGYGRMFIGFDPLCPYLGSMDANIAIELDALFSTSGLLTEILSMNTLRFSEWRVPFAIPMTQDQIMDWFAKVSSRTGTGALRQPLTHAINTTDASRCL